MICVPSKDSLLHLGMKFTNFLSMYVTASHIYISRAGYETTEFKIPSS
jgi:hypothetical protein